jgi:hypothetical protein
MAVLKCSTCTAPLDVEGTEQFVTCKFCKSRNRVMKTVQGPQLVKVDARGIGRLVLILVIAFVVLPIIATVVIMLVIGVGTAAVITQIPTPSATPAQAPHFAPAPPSPRAPPAGPTKISPSQLPTHTGGRGWIELDAPGMVGTFASFDPIANLPWVTSIAQAWTTDARIGSIYLNAVRPDGSMDLSSRSDWNADYRFFSPTRRESQRRMREVSEQEVHSELRVMVSASGVKVLINARPPTQLDTPDEPVLVTTCTTAQVQQLMTGAGLPARPTYDMMLTHLGGVLPGDTAGRPGWWRWTAHVPGSRPTQVDATTCALHR